MKLLVREELHANPIVQFSEWFAEAEKTLGIIDPNACCLSTLDEDGYPNSRMVLMKGFSEEGFTFFTNLRSVKARALAKHPRAALMFFWPSLRRQVRTQGDVTPLPASDADEYFRTRARESQIGAWASLQSEVLESRSLLDARIKEIEEKYAGVDEIPRPPNWGGFLLAPRSIEFWQERPARLHDRFRFSRDAGGRWAISQLFP